MITDEIMQIIYDMQEEIDQQIAQLNQEYNDKNLMTCEYTERMDTLEAKSETLAEVEEKLGNYEA